jgi:hypothetical protein
MSSAVSSTRRPKNSSLVTCPGFSISTMAPPSNASRMPSASPVKMYAEVKKNVMNTAERPQIHHERTES